MISTLFSQYYFPLLFSDILMSKTCGPSLEPEQRAMAFKQKQKWQWPTDTLTAIHYLPALKPAAGSLDGEEEFLSFQVSWIK